MRFLSVGPRICLQLPSDSTSRWTPLLFSYTFPTTWACSGLSPARARPWRANEKHPTPDTSRHLHFPTKKAPANQVTDAFVNIIILSVIGPMFQIPFMQFLCRFITGSSFHLCTPNNILPISHCVTIPHNLQGDHNSLFLLLYLFLFLPSADCSYHPFCLFYQQSKNSEMPIEAYYL